VIAPSFAEIFQSNCFKNGVLPVVLPPYTVDALFEGAAAGGLAVTVDLPAQRLLWGGGEASFEVDAFRKNCLVNGLDDIALTLQHAQEIRDFEARYRQRAPWLFG
jgi:3-isopropylmalate/(R)-2-methylmalate dehydratase small subunit